MQTFLSVLQDGKIASIMASIKTKNIKVKHPKRKLYRASEPLLSVFMWGINHTVRELSHISIPVMLMPDDFRAFTKIKVDSFAFNKENLPSHFKVRYLIDNKISKLNFYDGKSSEVELALFAMLENETFLVCLMLVCLVSKQKDHEIDNFTIEPSQQSPH